MCCARLSPLTMSFRWFTFLYSTIFCTACAVLCCGAGAGASATVHSRTRLLPRFGNASAKKSMARTWPTHLLWRATTCSKNACIAACLVLRRRPGGGSSAAAISLEVKVKAKAMGKTPYQTPPRAARYTTHVYVCGHRRGSLNNFSFFFILYLHSWKRQLFPRPVYQSMLDHQAVCHCNFVSPTRCNLCKFVRPRSAWQSTSAMC